MLWNKYKLIFFQVSKFSKYVSLEYFLLITIYFYHISISKYQYIYVFLKWYISEKIALKIFSTCCI